MRNGITELHPKAGTLVVAAMMLAVSCNGNGNGSCENPMDPDCPPPPPPTEVDVSGTWDFQYNSRTVTTQIKSRLELSQNGGQLTGEHTDTQYFGSTCGQLGCLSVIEYPPPGPVSGIIDGDQVSLTFAVLENGSEQTFDGQAVSDTRLEGSNWYATLVSPGGGGGGGAEVAAPTNLQAAQTAPLQVTLQWTDNSSNEDGFATAASCNGSDLGVVSVVSSDVTSEVLDFESPLPVSCEFRVFAFMETDPEKFLFSELSNAATVIFEMHPVIASINPTSGAVGTEVLLQGEAFDDLVDLRIGGVSAVGFVVEQTSSSIRFFAPNAGAAGTHDVVVVTAEGESAPGSWTQFGDVDDLEPNDTPEQAIDVPAEFAVVQSFHQSDRQDFYRIELSGPVELRARLAWNTTSDLDVIVQATDDAIPVEATPSAAYGNDLCDGTGATFDPEEEATCSLEAGTYVVHVIDYDWFNAGDAGAKSYVLVVDAP